VPKPTIKSVYIEAANELVTCLTLFGSVNMNPKVIDEGINSTFPWIPANIVNKFRKNPEKHKGLLKKAFLDLLWKNTLKNIGKKR
jgi:hypothetical protein